VRPAEEVFRLLAGDRMYAIGLRPAVALGDRRGGRAPTHHAARRAGRRSGGSWPRPCGSRPPVGWGSSDAHGRARISPSPVRRRRSRAMRTACGAHLSALIAASICSARCQTDASTSPSTRSIGKSREPSRRDGDAAAVHGRNGQRRGRLAAASFALPAWPLRSGRLKSTPHHWETSAPVDQFPETTTSRCGPR